MFINFNMSIYNLATSTSKREEMHKHGTVMLWAAGQRSSVAGNEKGIRGEYLVRTKPLMRATEHLK